MPKELHQDHLQALADLFSEEDTLRTALEAACEILAQESKDREHAELLQVSPNFNRAMQLAAEANAFGSVMAEIKQLVVQAVGPSGGQSAG